MNDDIFRAGSGADDPQDHEDREAILARRRRFVAAALSSLTLSATALVDCAPQPCLSPRMQDAQVADATPQPCLTAPPPDVRESDASEPDAREAVDAADVQDTRDAQDAQPMPCLSPPLPDGG
ncbi:MAG: hypothetical protein Q8Q09_08900 [Deltaproteobacteria bacterium]|nr:hypothetical protein [Deltaproteobacteria bacterium]